MNYQTWKLVIPPDYKPNEKECEACEGIGHTNESYCCGAEIDSDILICHDCKDHSDFAECEECNGLGVIITNDLKK